MAPTKSRNTHEDKSEGKDKDKSNASNGTHSSTKMRRGASQANHARDQAAAVPPPAPVITQEPPAVSQSAIAQPFHTSKGGRDSLTGMCFSASSLQVQFQTFDRKALQAYRREYNLDTPLAFGTSYNHFLLLRPGSIGLYSPTMARKRKQRRQTKEQLAIAVRKHFNSIGVQENDVIVDLIHSVHNKGPKALKQKPDEQSLVEIER